MNVRDDESFRLRMLSLSVAVTEDWEAAEKNAVQAQRLLKATGPEELRAAAAATFLVRFYTGIEQIFQRIAQEFDGGLPAGPAWHRELLMAMARDIPTSRPAFLSPAVRDRLDEYRKFRHRVIHPYEAELDWVAMRPLIERLESLTGELREALNRFKEFLGKLAQ